MSGAFANRIQTYLEQLTAYPDRHVGSEGNRAATELFAAVALSHGLEVARTWFDCIEWEYGAASLDVGGEHFDLNVGPYSLAAELRAPLVCVSSAEELDAQRVEGAIVLLHGEIARGQFMPRNFTFYNPESHKHVYRLLETRAPVAVVAATGTDPQLVGGQYPFPLFEDGDLDIPNAYMKDVDGERMLAHDGKEVVLAIDSRRVPASAEHVVATKRGSAPERVVVFAHIDSRKDSPGALDNASGVASLLGLVELLDGYESGPSVEIVPLNGEDNYANPGEMLWVAENEGHTDDIVLGINIDDAGWRGHDTCVSFYQCPDRIERLVRDTFAGRPNFAEGPRWVQSDHMIFGIYGRPAIALASSEMEEFMAVYAHTERDTIELADAGAIAEIARFLRQVVSRIAP